MHASWPSLLSVLSLAAFIRAETPNPASPPTPSPFEGVWLGTVTLPNGRTDIGFAFKRDPKTQALNASFTMPAMFIPKMGLGPAQITDGTYTLDDFGVKLSLPDDKLVGTFANSLLHVELQRADHFPAVAPLPDLPAGPAPLWTTSLGAETWATPVARDGIIYLGCVDGKFHALRASDGSEKWSWTGENPIYGQALVTDDRIYFLDHENAVVALNRADGHLLWRASIFDQGYTGKPAPKNPTFNRRVPTPVITDNTLFIGSTDHGLYALDATTGKINWRHDVGAAVFATVTVDGGELIVGSYDGGIEILDRATGAETMRTKIGGQIASAPVVAGDTLLVGCRDYLLYGLKRSDLSVVWRDSYWFSWVESVPVVVDGLAYIGGSDYRRISAIEPSTGKARWATDVRGIAWGTPVVTTHSVYEGTSAQNPAAIHHEGGITALDRITGKVKWRHVTPLPPKAERAGYIGSLVLVDGKIIGAGFDGVVVAYPAN